MILYSILSSKRAGIDRCDISLQKACQELGIQYERIFFDKTTLDDLRGEFGGKTGLLYRISTNKRAAQIEGLLGEFAPGLTTISWSTPVRSSKLNWYELREQTNRELPIIPTILLDPTWTEMDDNELTRRLDKIDGFPIILKTLGLSHGAGVRKIDSLQEFKDVLPSTLEASHNIIARKYLADYRHYRIIVLNDAVAAAIEYHKPDNDFRTNATKHPVVTAVDNADVPKDVADAAIEGTGQRGSIFGGADVLVDLQTGIAHLAEVNIPCFFARAEEPTGIHIGKLLVEALRLKA